MIHYKNSYKFSIAFILTVILWLLIALPSASAATATEVWVNNVKLDSSAYYLANGSGTATTTKPASGGYAYFDAASGTLTLYNMQLDTLHTYATYDSLLFANGDLEIVLTGASTLQYNNSNIGTYMGIYVQGLLTISGSGSASIQFDSTALGTAVYGIYSHDMAIASGTLNVRTSGLYVTHGIVSYSDIYITGGNTTVQIDAIYAIGFLMQTGDFRMTGGTANATVSAEVGRDRAHHKRYLAGRRNRHVFIDFIQHKQRRRGRFIRECGTLPAAILCSAGRIPRCCPIPSPIRYRRLMWKPMLRTTSAAATRASGYPRRTGF